MRDRDGFSRKNFLAQKIEKMAKKWPKASFFEFSKKFYH